MTLTSLSFLAFVLLAAASYQLAVRLPWLAARAVVLLGCNLWFVASFTTGGWRQLVPMAGFVVFGLLVTEALRRLGPSRPFAPWVLLTLGIFFWLKKYSFVPEDLWLSMVYLQLGLSYILFRVLQIMIDVREGQVTRRVGLLDYLNYMLNFPTFMSGPIQRFQDWQAQHRQPLAVHWEPLGEAIERMVLGAFKVVVIAPLLLGWHQAATTALAQDSTALARGWHGAVMAGGYAVYLFLNFSGYTDLVIGVGQLLGQKLPENFNRPFAAASFLDFWARWHMSLSDWLKTYVYSPLVKSLMRRYPSRAFEPYIGVCAFFVTFFLIGLWHGQTMVFVLYGFLLGLGVSGNKLHQIFMAKRLGRKRYNELSRKALYLAVGRGLTFTWFALSLVCFWAKWVQITAIAGALGWAGFGLMAMCLLAAAGLLFSVADATRTAAFRWQLAGAPALHHRYLRTVVVTTMAFAAVATATLTSGPAPDIVYKNF